MTSRIVSAAMLAGALAGLTACRHLPFCHASPSCPAVCQENLRDGLATILCQPMDAEVTNDQPEVEFKVEATGDQRTYRWFFVDPATGIYSPLPEKRGEGREKYAGTDSPRLTIKRPTGADFGFYACEIDTLDRFGLPVKTQTRPAALGGTVAYALISTPNIFAVVQPLPMPGGSSPAGACNSSACSVVTYRNQNAGYQLTAGKHFFDLALTNTVNHTGQAPLDPHTYQIVIGDANGASSRCATMDNNRWCFTAANGHLYLFAVYFNCGQAPRPTTACPNLALRLNP